MDAYLLLYMALFSERYGYVSPREQLIRETITEEVQNAICSAFDMLESELHDSSRYYFNGDLYANLELAIWIHFLNQRKNNFYCYDGHKIVITSYIESDNPWYKKLDLLEYAIHWMSLQYEVVAYREQIPKFISYLNKRFKALGFAYRIINHQVCEITSEEELKEIEQALSYGDIIKKHFDTALSLMSKRPDPDFRNSIKESISAVEHICRVITSEITLGQALNKLEANGVIIPRFLKDAFTKLYVYTNDSTTGIRHALMDDTYTPGFDEAKFMLVSCCAFVNYIKAKA